ncbi:MAG: TonB-dependent receptor [Steroidobacteraceae bacterium]
MSEIACSRSDCATALRSFVVAFTGMFATPALVAQERAGERIIDLGEIVVTATRRPVPLQDVPIAVSVLLADDILERGYTEYGNYLNSLPGVYFADAGPSRSVIRIRGLSAAEGGLPTLVGTYFGETPTSVDGTYPNLRLVDIERVEVLRGPQGTLFGANALAGAVRILPAQPGLQSYQASFGARGFETAHSDDESYHIEGVINLPLVKDQFALRFVGYKDDIAGYIDNVFPGQPALDYSILGDILFGLPPGTLPPGTLVVPAVAPFERQDVNREDTTGGRAAATWQVTERLRFELGFATQEATLESEPHVTPFVDEYAQSRSLDVYSRGEGGEEIDISNLTVRYDWEAMSFTSSTAFSNIDEHNFVDVTEAAVAFFGVPIPTDLRSVIQSEAFTQELRLQSRGAGAFQWLFGAFYLDRDREAGQDTPDYSCPACLPLLATGTTTFLEVNQIFTEEQRAVFGEVSYDLSSRWTVSAGARYLEQDLHLRISPAIGLLAATVPVTDEEGAIEEFNPSLHLRFRPSDELTLYAQAARGFRSGRPNQSFPAPCLPDVQAQGVQPITDPDTLWNYELGLKSSFADDRVSFNAAIYDADWDGIQLGVVVNPATCPFVALVNGGDATTRGVEAEFAAQASDAWSFNLAASYNETEFDQVDPRTGFVDGERVPGTPRTNASAGLQYDFPVGSEWSGFARADYSYVGDIRLIFGTQRFTQDGYGTGNLRLGFSNDRLALELFARNVTDKRAVLSTGSPDPVFGSDQILLRPREVGIELRYSYE